MALPARLADWPRAQLRPQAAGVLPSPRLSPARQSVTMRHAQPLGAWSVSLACPSKEVFLTFIATFEMPDFEISTSTGFLMSLSSAK
jgi:hypothetical protein